MNAVYGIANAGVHRRKRGSGRMGSQVTLALYIVSSTCAGVATGALLGAAGGLIPAAGRVAAATGLALLVVVFGIWGGLYRVTPPFQCDRETPRTWVDRGAVSWAIR